MPSEPATSVPQRKRPLLRWLLVIILATYGYGWSRGYTIRATVGEARALWWKWANTWPFRDD